MSFKTIDGRAFRDLFLSGTKKLGEAREYLNSINVFPVPDGDTGSNMADTMRGTADALHKVSDPLLSNVLKKISTSLRLEARGNSGIIISEFFTGMIKSFPPGESLNVSDFVNGISEGKKSAYASVANPVEGTMLTVIRKMSERVILEKENINNLKKAVELMVATGQTALEETMNEMELLRENKVVDSGANGILLFWEGALMYLNGEYEEKHFAPNRNVLKQVEVPDIKWRYCTEGLVKSDRPFERKDVSEKLAGLGDSLIVICDEELIKVHIHSNEPPKVFEVLEQFGEIIKTKAEDMIEQSKRERAEQSTEASRATIGIVADSTCDLDLATREDMSIEMIPLQIMFGEQSWRDRVEISAREFYKKLQSEKVSPKTSLPKGSDFLQGYEHVASRHKTILALYLSSKLSGTWQAGKKWGEEFEDADVISYDTESVSLGAGLLAREAARMAAEGARIDVIIKRLDEIKSKMAGFITVSTLKYLARSGRISGSKKIFGEALNVKPILKCEGGQIVECSKAFGIGGMKKELKRLITEKSKNKNFEGHFGIATAGEVPYEDDIMDWIRKNFEISSITTAEVSPVIGAHAGPGALAVFCY